MTNRSDGALAPVKAPLRWRLRSWGALLFPLLFIGITYLALYLPLIVMALFSVNDSSVQTLPFKGFTFHWYSKLASDAVMQDALLYSLKIALGVVVISAIAGLTFALLFDRVRFRGSALLAALIALPFALPGIVLGISLVIIFRGMNIVPGTLTIMVGQATFVTPVIMFIVLQRLRTLEPALDHASMDLGAGPWRTLWHVTLPGVRVPLFAGCLLGFTLSFDEITVTNFLAGNDQTLPVYVFTLLRFGFSPEVNAVFTLIFVISVGLIALTALLLAWKGGIRNGKTSGVDDEERDARELQELELKTVPQAGT